MYKNIAHMMMSDDGDWSNLPPRRPRHFRYADTEPAFVVAPWEDCCDDDPKDCICVTSADAERWNRIEELSAIKPSDISGISAYQQVITSAGLWNGNYVTVSQNSAYWNSFSAYQSDLSGLSADVNYLSAQIDNIPTTVTTQYPIVGNGTESSPIALSANFYDTINKVISLMQELYPDLDKDNKQWLDLDFWQKFYEYANYNDTQHAEITNVLRSHNHEIQWILTHMNEGGGGSTSGWKGVYLPNLEDNLDQCVGENIFYFDFDE